MLTAGVKFVSSGISNDMLVEEGACTRETRSASQRWNQGHRIPTSCQSLQRAFSRCLVLASLSTERPHNISSAPWRQGRSNFSCCFSLLESQSSRGKLFMGFRRAKSAQGNAKCQKMSNAKRQKKLQTINLGSPHAGLNPLSTGQSKIGRRRPISLDYHCVNISQRIFINKISLERSFHYLNADTLFLKIGQEMTPLQPFEVTQLIDFALNRSTSVTCGRDFAHSIAMVTWNV